MSQKFSVGTFNAYNLQLAGERVYDDVMYDDDAYAEKVRWQGAQMKRMGADLFGFQEIWSAAALKDVVAESGLFTPDQVYVPRPEGEADGEKIAVALATKFPIVSAPVSIKKFPDGMRFSTGEANVEFTEFSRAVLSCEVMLPGDLRTKVYVAHLKSKRPQILDGEDRDDPRVLAVGYARSLLLRAAESAALRVLLVDDMQGTDLPVIVMGDLNDSAASVTTRIIAGDEPWGRNRNAAWDVLLYSTYELQAASSYRDVYYSHIHNGRYETLDHILISEQFAPSNRGRVSTFTGMDVWNDHLNGHPPQTQSDHAQVVAHFRTR